MQHSSDRLSVRTMAPEESSRVLKVMRSSFPLPMRAFLSTKGTVFLAEKGEKIIGGVVLGTLFRKKFGRIGIVSWLFTLPEERGQGAADLLLDHAVEHFSNISCREIVAVVEGYNTPSANRFIKRGFIRLTGADQISRYRSSLLHVMFHTLHFFDIGHFLWCRPCGEETIVPRRHSPCLQWVLTVCMHIAITFLLFRTLQAAVPVLIIFSLRTAGFKVGWRTVSKTPAVYHMWGTSFFMTLFVSIIFEGFFPSPGSWYPKEPSWSTHRYRDQLGVSSTAAAWTLILISFAAALLPSAGLIPSSNIIEYLGYLLIPFLVFDIMLPFFPFSCFLSGRIFNWKKGVYAVTWAGAAAALALLVLL